MAREFIVPGEIISGSGALDMAENALKLLGKKALIVTDKVMIDLGNCAKVEKALTNQGIAYSIYSDICGEPTDTMIEKGLQIYKDENCDFLVALGGGSPIDSMKAIGSLVVNGGSISDYMGKVIDVKMPPMAAIPTTAGTGSEATQFTIITDTKKDIKMLLKGKVLMPDLAIIDPQFTMTAPPKITAATGLDALCHCVEAYTSRKAQTLSDTFAVSAVKRIFKYLPVAYKDGKNEEARVQMSVAALEAGIAFNNASLGYVHAMAHQLGGFYNLPHGVCNAILLPHVEEFNLIGNANRFRDIAKAMGENIDGLSTMEAARKAIAAIRQLSSQVGIPQNLRSLGVKEEDFEIMAENAMKDVCQVTNPRKATKEQIVEIFRAAF